MQEKKDFSKQKKILAFAKFAILLAIVIGIPSFLYLKYGAEIFSKDAVDKVVAYLKAHEGFSALLVIGLQAIQVIICILPGQPIQFASSYMFGFTKALIFSLTGAVIGTTVSFFMSKLLGRDMLYILFDEEKVENYKRKLNSGKGISIVALIYLIPGVPKDLVSYVAGISDMKYRPFIIVSTICRTPGMFGSLIIGHFYGQGHYKAIIIFCIATAILLLICFIKRDAIMKKLDSLEMEG